MYFLAIDQKIPEDPPTVSHSTQKKLSLTDQRRIKIVIKDAGSSTIIAIDLTTFIAENASCQTFN